MRRILSAVASLAAATVLAASAQAQEVALTLHHFLGPKAPAQRMMLEPWAKSIEEASGGRIKVEIFPSMSLGGKPPELYRQARDGVVDIVWTVLGYTPGVFPRTEVFELPTVHRGSARETTIAISNSWDLIKDDYTDIQPILVHVHGGQAFHMVDKPVRTPADLEGLKIRTPSRIGGWIIESLGAEPVGMPIPDLPQALSKGVVSGALAPFEIVFPLKLQELTSYSIQGPNSLRFGTSTLMIAMNKDRYDSLLDDLKKVIDDHSMANIAATYGAVWDDIEESGKKLISENGELITLSETEYAQFETAMAPVVDKWIAEASGNGLDGVGMVGAARSAVAKAAGD